MLRYLLRRDDGSNATVSGRRPGAVDLSFVCRNSCFDGACFDGNHVGWLAIGESPDGASGEEAWRIQAEEGGETHLLRGVAFGWGPGRIDAIHIVKDARSVDVSFRVQVEAEDITEPFRFEISGKDTSFSCEARLGENAHCTRDFTFRW